MKKWLEALVPALACFLAVSCGNGPVRGFVARGGVHFESSVAGENSLKSLDMAADAGFCAVATDCRLTADSVFVVMAEPAINRACLNRDFSPVQNVVELSSLTLDSLRRGYVLRARLEEDCEAVPTLAEFLSRCRENGLKAFIRTAVEDSSGLLRRGIVSLADSVMGKGNYFLDGDVHFVSTMGCRYDEYYATLARDREEGTATMTETCLAFQDDQTRFESFALENSVEDVNYIVTDFAAPDFRDARRKGKLVLSARSLEDYFGKLVKYRGDYDPMAVLYGMDDEKHTTPPLKFGAIYLEMTFEGIGALVVDEDYFVISSSGFPDGRRTIQYNRLVHDCVPTITVDDLSPDFKILSTRVRILEF